jgi:hypothetical protein
MMESAARNKMMGKAINNGRLSGVLVELELLGDSSTFEVLAGGRIGLFVNAE